MAVADLETSRAVKLAKLPPDIKIQKRPLLRNVHGRNLQASQQVKVVYLNSKMPFMAACKRVKQLLQKADDLEAHRALNHAKRTPRANNRLSRAINLSETHAVVVVKATGKAIDKALELGLFLQRQRDLDVTIKTGSISTIDDLVPKEEIFNLFADEVKPLIAHTPNVEAPPAECVGQNGAESSALTSRITSRPLAETAECRTRISSTIEIKVTLQHH